MIKYIFVVFVFFTLSACTSPFEPRVNGVPLENKSIYSYLPSLNVNTVDQSDSKLITCLGRGADATFRQSDSADISVSLINTGDDKVGNTESSGETEMMGRTPGVLMTRELFYRTCEFSKNYKLSQDQALKLYLQTLNAASKGWISEVEKTTITIGETTSVVDNNTVSNDYGSETTVSNSDTDEAIEDPSPQPSQ
jgi:hypothetical protein